MSQFGKVVNVTLRYPLFAFVDFSDSTAMNSALESRLTFTEFSIHEKTPRTGENVKMNTGNRNKMVDDNDESGPN